MTNFARGWKFYQTKKEEETAEVKSDDLGGYCYPDSMLEPYDVERERELTN